MKYILFILSLLFAVPATANITIVDTAGGVTANKKTVFCVLNTVGASSAWVGISDYQAAAAGTLTDSRGNSCPLIRTNNDGSLARVRVYGCQNLTGFSTTDTFTYTSAADVFPTIQAISLAGTATSSPLDQQNGTGLSSALSGQPGSITPTQNGEMILTWCNSLGSTPSPTGPTVSAGFQRWRRTNYLSNNNFASAAAYYLQTTATAVNPTWTYSNFFSSAIIQISIKADGYTSTTGSFWIMAAGN